MTRLARDESLLYSSVRRIFEKGGGGARKFEYNEEQNKNFSTSPFSCPKSGEYQKKKKRSSLRFGPVFGQKLGESQKKGLRSPFVCSNLLPKLQRRGPCCNFAYYSMLIILSRPWPPLNTPLLLYNSHWLNDSRSNPANNIVNDQLTSEQLPQKIFFFAGSDAARYDYVEYLVISPPLRTR